MLRYFFILGILFYSSLIAGQTQLLTGVVKDKHSGARIEFCSVQLLNSNQHTLTNQLGEFSLSIDTTKENRLVLKAYGYSSDTIFVDKFDKLHLFLQADEVELETIVVSGATKASVISENPLAITAISAKQLDNSVENTVMDVLVKHTPGLHALKTGPNISKPFIHGLGYNRVLTLYDGIRQEGQQYGDEHGLEIDDYNVAKVEVIKGPASLLYGSDAIGGVISFFSPIPKMSDGKFHGKIVSEYQTNNGLIGNALRLDYSNLHWYFALRGSYRMAKNYRNALDERVYLTNFNELNTSGTAGYRSAKGYTHLSWTLYNNHQGIPDGSRDSLTRKFTKQVFDGEEDDELFNRPIVSKKELNSYRIPVLSQHIQHYRLYLQNTYEIGVGDIDLLLGLQQNRRREYTYATEPKQAGMDMRLNTLNYSFRYNAPEIYNVAISVGMNGMFQKNKNLNATFFPIPDYTLGEGGLYLFSKWKKNKWTISGGLRFDVRHVQWNDFYVIYDEVNEKSQKVSSDTEGATLQFAENKRYYNGFSGSIGATYKLTSALTMKMNVGRAYRAPSISEIGSNGLDPGAHIIYIGNRTFSPEFSLQEDVGVLGRWKNWSFEFNVFNNNVQNFIYMAMDTDADGNPLIDNQGNRTYKFQQAKAHLYGGDVWVAIHPVAWKGFRVDNSLSVVYGFNRNAEFRHQGTQGAYLPLIPPLTIRSSAFYKYLVPIVHYLAFTPKVEVEFVDKQNRFLGLNETETSTASYTLFNIGIVVETRIGKSNSLQFIFQANNVFNRLYHSHLNRLKYFEHFESSTSGHEGIHNMGRNLTFKVVFSF